MKPEEMTKIRIVTPKSLGNGVIDALYSLSALHVKQHHTEYNLQSGSPLPESEELSKAWLKVRTLKSELDIPNAAKNSVAVKKILKIIGKLYDDVQQMKAKEQALAAQLSSTSESYGIASALDSLDIDVSLIHKLRHASCFLGFVRDSAQLSGKLQMPHELKQKMINKQALIALFVRKQDELRTQAALHELGWSPLGIPQKTAALKRQSEMLQKELKELKSKREAIKKGSAQFIADAEAVLEAEIKKAELPLQFATTAQSFIATGFVPAKSMHEIKSTLDRAAKKSIFIEELNMHHDEKVPVKLANKKNVKNFEVLTRLYELPNYFELDPTSLLYITFPLFFGIMLGDVGYGIVTLALFMLLKRKFPDLKPWFVVLIYASVISIAFGFVFGEYFGFESISMENGASLCNTTGICLAKEIVGHHGKLEVVYTFPRLLNRVHGTVAIGNMKLLSILALGIVIGAVHLNIGLLIGFYNVWKAHGLKLAVLEKLSWLLLEAGLAVLVLSVTNKLPLHWGVGTGILLISVVALYLGEGAKGIIEIPALFSNMLSYMRLGAVGLASVGLAVVVNENLALPLFEKGGIFIAIAIIIMFLGHGINIILGIIGPFLHSVRLHYVECFSKFFHGGGIEYTPFGKKAQTGGEL